ncbi:MAG: PHP-associated domain-containing protein [Candidatus Methylacidiphilales bacterium]|nr:PHP-associated domain-containing protein [Candidatus Methylacidiphilales bacterium]
MPTYRVELHNHCDCDPQDALDYSARDLVDACVARGVQVLAITPHREVFHDPDAVNYARSRGVLLLPGVEKMIEGREIVLINVAPGDIPHLMAREDLEALRLAKGGDLLVLAPHPFYPRDSCVGPVLDRFARLIDVIEWCHLYLGFYNPNRRAAEWAEKNHKPLIATSDTHALALFGRNTAVVEAETLEARAVFQAIRAGKITNTHRPYGLLELATFVVVGFLHHEMRKWARKLLPAPSS